MRHTSSDLYIEQKTVLNSCIKIYKYVKRSNKVFSISNFLDILKIRSKSEYFFHKKCYNFNNKYNMWMRGKIMEASKSERIMIYPMWLEYILKYLLYFFWALFLLVQIKTTEDLFSTVKFQVNIFNPDISVLWQLPGLFFGGNTVDNNVVLPGWIVEVLYLASVMKVRSVLSQAERIHRLHAKVVIACILICTAINVFTDFLYGPTWFFGNAILGHIIYTIVAESTIIYAPVIASTLG